MSGVCDRPWVVYVTGGMGSGKSSVSKALEAAGVDVLDLDEVGHEALESSEVRSSLLEAFGPGVFGEDGSVVRSKLAKAAFASASDLAKLNEATTPFIVGRMREWIERRKELGRPLCAVEVSAYDGPRGRFPGADEVVVVTAPLEARVSRAVAAGFPEDDVRARIARQPSDELRREWADEVVVNDGSLADLDRKVREWLARTLEEHAPSSSAH